MGKQFYFAFLLGRPGCGKSAIYRLLTKYLQEANANFTFERVDDFPLLDRLLKEDTEFKRHVRKQGGFAVTDFTIVDEALQLLNGELLKKKADNHIIFIEFARPDYTHALSNFTRELLDDAAIFYVRCSYDTCCDRNVNRFKLQKDDAVDDHIVPPDLMESYYKDDNYEALWLDDPAKLEAEAACPIYVIDNEEAGLERLEAEIKNIVAMIKA